MKFGQVATEAGTRLVAVYNGRQVDVATLIDGGPQTLDELLSAPGTSLDAIADALDADAGFTGDVADERPWLPPLQRPSTIIAIGLNYHDHCREFGVVPPAVPTVFAKLPGSVIGDGDAIAWDEAITRQVDWEVELGVVIGRETWNVSVDEAEDAIFGYTIVNDVTARDLQRAEPQWVRAKSLQTFCPIGPIVVTRDEIPDVQRLPLRTRVNGVTMQDSTTAEMVFSVRELVSFLSRSIVLRPGDLIATGTPVGVGAFREPPVFLRDGDEVEVEIEGIGTLRNRCIVRPQR
jgi:5-carboxymethyl-2-hydroxymuconate isomerase